MNNSVCKTFIANDSISNETLLSYHYRCAPKIIQFNNKLNIEKNKDSQCFIEVDEMKRRKEIKLLKRSKQLQSM